MGYVGAYLVDKGVGLINRITALDPAGPYFQDTEPQVRLDPTDAVLVDAIHTDNTPLIPGFPISR